MKKTKVIIPALGLLLLSTAASVTGTVAWFASNSNVTASGMQITAKTDSSYLLIGSGDNDTATEIQALGDEALTTTLTVAESAMLPSAHDAIASATAAGTVANWYTASGTSQANYALKAGSKTALTEENFAKYVIKRTVYLTVAKDSVKTGDVTIALNMTEIAAAGAQHDYDPVSVVFASESTVLEFNEANNWINAGAITTQVQDNGVKTVDIYVYYDGNNEDVFTNNFANLSGATIGITFTAA